ncbi:hypothetical protein HK096_000237, partial [Nowakowskiella sp. JEL0078]
MDLTNSKLGTRNKSTDLKIKSKLSRSTKSKLNEAGRSHRLDLRFQNLSALPTLPPNVTILLLGNNKFDTLPTLPASLRFLDVSSNNFKEIPKAVFDLPDLVIADFSGNASVTDLPSRSRSSAILVVNPEAVSEIVDKNWFDGKHSQPIEEEFEKDDENDVVTVDDGRYHTDDEEEVDDEEIDSDGEKSDIIVDSWNGNVDEEIVQRFLELLAGSEISDKDIDTLKSRLNKDGDFKWFVQHRFANEDKKQVQRWMRYYSRYHPIGVGSKDVDELARENSVSYKDVSHSKTHELEFYSRKEKDRVVKGRNQKERAMKERENA